MQTALSMPVIAFQPPQLPEATTASQIADYLIAFSSATGSLITNMKLQKLAFYTQAWHIAVFNEEIFEEDFQAWIHGPVLPSLYNQYKSFQWRPILRDDLSEASLPEMGSRFSSSVNKIIEDVISEYFPKDAFALEKSTHEEAPWRSARGILAPDEPCTNIIDKKTIHDYYSQFVKSDGQELHSAKS
jgi:uncharacterized phage-associated protein